MERSEHPDDVAVPPPRGGQHAGEDRRVVGDSEVLHRARRHAVRPQPCGVRDSITAERIELRGEDRRLGQTRVGIREQGRGQRVAGIRPLREVRARDGPQLTQSDDARDAEGPGRAQVEMPPGQVGDGHFQQLEADGETRPVTVRQGQRRGDRGTGRSPRDADAVRVEPEVRSVVVQPHQRRVGLFYLGGKPVLGREGVVDGRHRHTCIGRAAAVRSIRRRIVDSSDSECAPEEREPHGDRRSICRLGIVDAHTHRRVARNGDVVFCSAKLGPRCSHRLQLFAIPRLCRSPMARPGGAAISALRYRPPGRVRHHSARAAEEQGLPGIPSSSKCILVLPDQIPPMHTKPFSEERVQGHRALPARGGFDSRRSKWRRGRAQGAGDRACDGHRTHRRSRCLGPEQGRALPAE